MSRTPDEISLGELFRLIGQFQDLRFQTGCSKSSSYHVSLGFDVNGDDMTIILGSYDVGDWPRNLTVNTTRHTLMGDLQATVTKAEEAVAEDLE